MNIGLIIHSQTNNTLSVAEKIKSKLESAGHIVSIKRMFVEGDESQYMKNIGNVKMPDISEHDALVLGAPVWGFTLSPVMKAFLTNIPQQDGMKAACYVTEQFPKAWLGGNSAIKKYKKLCSFKGLNLLDTGIVNWSAKNRDASIDELTERFGKAF